MQTHAHRHFVAECAGAVTVLTLTKKELDDPTAERLAEELFDFSERFTGSDLCLDMGAVAYLSSTALGKFVSLNRKLKASGGRLCLIKVDPTVYELFSLTRLTTVLDVRRKIGTPV